MKGQKSRCYLGINNDFRYNYLRDNKMHILWGILIAFAGLFLTICGTLKSNFIIYRLIVYRSKILWGDNVHRFHQIAGLIVIVFGVLVALGYI